MKTTLAILCLSAIAFSVEGPPPVSSRLSPALKRRLAENLLVLNQNIEKTKVNLENVTKNETTLAGEVKELAELEKQNLTLKRQYEAYLADTAASNETDEKRKRMVEGLAQLDSTLHRVHERQARIDRERADWKARRQEHETLLQDLKAKSEATQSQLQMKDQATSKSSPALN